MSSDDILETEPAPTETDVQSSGGLSRRSHISIILVALGVVAIVALLNWPYQFTIVDPVPTGNVQGTPDFKPVRKDLPVMAGWPYRYWIHYAATDSGAPDVSRFSALALTYNLLLAAVVAIGTMLYAIRRELKVTSHRARITIADLMVLTLLLAAPFGWWQQASRRSDREHELAAALVREGGQHEMSTWIPEVFESWYPKSLTSKLRRLHHVRIEYPSNELMEQLVGLRELTLLRVGGGEYDLALLQQLAANPHLVDLRIAGRVIDAPTIHAIASHRRLHTLNLMRTNVTAEALEALGQLPNLERVSLVHSDVVLSELGAPGWSKSVEALRFGHPDPGEEASLKIAGWPKLDSVAIYEYESQLNSTAMQVELSDLPSLKSVQLDVFQKFDLTLHDVPKLKTIKPLALSWQSRLPRGGSAPGEIWCGRLDIDGAESLERLSFFSLGLKHLRIRRAPNLDWLGIAAFFKTQSSATYASELTVEAATALISGLGESEGPPTVDLDYVPLAGVDLAPLANNQQITKLLLSQSGTTLEQWKALEQMKGLVRFDVKDCEIDGDGVQWVLDTFPNLEHFAFSAGPNWDSDSFHEGASVLEFVDRPELKTIDLGNSSTEFLSTVRVVNSPNLHLDLALGYLEKLEISNAPSLTGLRISGPVPPDATLSGVRDLRFLAVGGPTVGDDFIAGANDCESLQTLTLAYPAVTAAGLKQLTNLQGIISLNLPGSAVNDEVIAAWPEMPMLAELDLRDTAITGASLKRLLSASDVTRVLLDQTKVDKTDLSMLGNHVRLAELSLAGVGIDAKTLDQIFANGSLRRLNLSGTTLTPEVVDVITSHAGQLNFLVLRECEIDEKKLHAIATRNRNLRFDLSGSNISTQLMTSLLAARRVVDQREWEQQIAMQNMFDEYGQRQEVDPAQLDIHFFAELAQQPAQPATVLPSGTFLRPSSVPLGVRMGRWLGNAILPPESDEESDASDPTLQTPDDNGADNAKVDDAIEVELEFESVTSEEADDAND